MYRKDTTSINHAGQDAVEARVTVGTSTTTLDLTNQTTMEDFFMDFEFQSVELLALMAILSTDGNTYPKVICTNLIIPCDTNVLFNIHSDKWR